MKNLFITSRVKNVNHNPQYRSDIRNIVDHQAQQCQDKSQHLNGVTGDLVFVNISGVQYFSD
jgi:hypothetical protein